MKNEMSITQIINFQFSATEKVALERAITGKVENESPEEELERLKVAIVFHAILLSFFENRKIVTAEEKYYHNVPLYMKSKYPNTWKRLKVYFEVKTGDPNLFL